MKKAFTMAEVLVTLGIIGIVSAMTVPTFLQNHQRKSYVTQIHKIYNEMQQAALQYMTNRNAVNLIEAGLITDINAVDTFMKTYFRVIKECGENPVDNGCVAQGYKKLTGKTITPFNVSVDYRSYVIASGAVIALFNEGDHLQVHVDINGQKGPNIAGRDLFAFHVYKNGVIDDFVSGAILPPLTREQREDSYNKWCNSSSAIWYGCLGKLINDNWEMTY
ncbi:TPA: prepilin-type N-terminal cleavage/methylation domain-containing protein [Candidatus Gastranaerophilales bacterium HUM_20]|nr:pilin protein [Clostridium sp. CAG:729]DAB21810.1 MAG TPA: prepilin-type N-terminal cleavage/methylation domain-containing protein [Candidatus Gastranaerophilales bacterium HUM_20]